MVRNFLIEDKSIRDKTKAIFSFASPMGGSSIAAIAKALGLGSVQTAQLGSGADDPDSVFNTLKDNWYRAKVSIPSFCAYETETTKGVIVVTRASVEPLCTHDVLPLRGAHTPIIQPPTNGVFFAHEYLKQWMRSVLPNFEEAASASETNNQVVVANCSGNEAYRGPYGKTHTRVRDSLKSAGIDNVRYSLPLSQIWSGDKSTSQFFLKVPPSDIIIHLSCFQNALGDSQISIQRRDTHFLDFLKSFSGYPTNIVVYSRTFGRYGCQPLMQKLRSLNLADVYKDRLKLIPIKDGEVPGENSSADQTLVSATTFKRSTWKKLPNECFG